MGWDYQKIGVGAGVQAVRFSFFGGGRELSRRMRDCRKRPR